MLYRLLPQIQNMGVCQIRTLANAEIKRPGPRSGDGKRFGPEVAVIPAVAGGKAQHAIIRIGDARRIVLLISIPPDEFAAFCVGQDFHPASQHDAAEKAAVAEIDARFRLRPELRDAERRKIRREIELADAVSVTRRVHRLHIREPVPIDRPDHRNAATVDQIADCVLRIAHHRSAPFLNAFSNLSGIEQRVPASRPPSRMKETW